ncbi:MAG: LysR family transcriptional regulator substrate-binding protein, partial [Verrucomicrobia bacterium]|nr:LysR family transcriptional regulator substrate-binding protein [Verrucomicrobiota bacterium]
RWLKMEDVPRDELSEEPFISYSKSSRTFRMIDSHFRREDVSLNVVAELGSMDAIKEFVARELGITILASWLVRREIAEKRLQTKSLGERSLKREWGFFWLQERRMSLAEETFLQTCRDKVAENR